MTSSSAPPSMTESPSRPGALSGRAGGATSIRSRTVPSVALLCAAAIVVVGQLYIVLPLLGDMGRGLETPAAELTAAMTAFGLGYAGGFLFAGPLADRYRPRALVAGGLGATALVTAAVPLATGPGELLALRAGQGLVAAAFVPAALSYIARGIRGEHRGAAVSAMTSSMLSAAVLVQLAAHVLVGPLGWRGVFLIAAAGLALLAALTRWQLSPVTDGSPGLPLTRAFLAVPELLVRPRLIGLYLGSMTVLAAFVAVQTTLTLSPPAHIAVAGPSATPALRASILPGLLVVPLLHRTLGRRAARGRAVVGLLGGAAALAVAARWSENAGAVLMALPLFAVAVAVAAPALVELVDRTAPARCRATATALFACATFVGAGLGGHMVSAAGGLDFAVIVGTVATAMVVGALVCALATSSGAGAATSPPATTDGRPNRERN